MAPILQVRKSTYWYSIWRVACGKSCMCVCVHACCTYYGHETYDAVMLAGMLNHAPPDLNMSEDVAGDGSQNRMETPQSLPLDTEQKAHVQVPPQPAEVQIFGTDTAQR